MKKVLQTQCQVLAFEPHKHCEPFLLDKAFTEQSLVTSIMYFAVFSRGYTNKYKLTETMLYESLVPLYSCYRYIGPLRDEAASWAEKLKEVAEVLELWLEVQDLWQYLEAVFSNQITARVSMFTVFVSPRHVL